MLASLCASIYTEEARLFLVSTAQYARTVSDALHIVIHVPPYASTESVCHTRFWKANRMRTMYVSGSETHVHSDYIIGHHHTMLKVNSGKILYYNKMSETSIESNT
jgi:hypothetical protein